MPAPLPTVLVTKKKKEGRIRKRYLLITVRIGQTFARWCARYFLYKDAVIGNHFATARNVLAHENYTR